MILRDDSGEKHDTTTMLRISNSGTIIISPCAFCWSKLTMQQRLECVAEMYKQYPQIETPWETTAARIWAGGTP